MSIFWSLVFFFASAGASAAYLTISEIFPLEVRALGLAFFYFIGTAFGGISGPIIYGWLVQSGSRIDVFFGYCGAVCLMLVGGIVAAVFWVDAELKSLEDIARPINEVTTYQSEMKQTV